MTVSVVILNWNTKRLLQQCLQSLVSSLKDQRLKIEIIVVDNGSTDGSREYLRGLKATGFFGRSNPKITVIFNRKNLGFAKGNNQGIKIAKGKYIIILNSDTKIQEGALEELVGFLDRNPEVAAVSPLLLNSNGTPQIDYYMRFPNLWQIFFYHLPFFRPIALKIPFWRNLICFSAQPVPFEVDQLPGTALMASKEIWTQVGFFDEDYRFLYEDVDWCWRAKKKGFKLMVVPQAKVIHLGGASWRKKLKEDSLEFYRQFFSSMLLFVKKNYGRSRLRLFRFALLVNFCLTFKFKLAGQVLRGNFKQQKLWR